MMIAQVVVTAAANASTACVSANSVSSELVARTKHVHSDVTDVASVKPPVFALAQATGPAKPAMRRRELRRMRAFP